jgi:hypothetical protein
VTPIVPPFEAATGRDPLDALEVDVLVVAGSEDEDKEDVEVDACTLVVDVDGEVDDTVVSTDWGDGVRASEGDVTRVEDVCEAGVASVAEGGLSVMEASEEEEEEEEERAIEMAGLGVAHVRVAAVCMARCSS